jgi:hypothetical protein
MMKLYARRAAVIAACVLMSACTSNSPFPPKVMNTAVPPIQFEAWRDAGPSNPSGKSDAGLRLELGGRIIQTIKEDKGVVVVAEQLPIVTKPAYGPTEENVQRQGDYEFAFLYPGELNAQALRSGQRFVVVGVTTSRRPVIVNGKPKTEPFLVADCIHIVSGQTYCVAQQ